MSEKRRRAIVKAIREREDKQFTRGTYLLYLSVVAEIILISNIIK